MFEKESRDQKLHKKNKKHSGGEKLFEKEERN